jgi:hypothetical protein
MLYFIISMPKLCQDENSHCGAEKDGQYRIV